ncbi:DUF4082 domain-containing protein [Tautonia plasticadhaerens]|uniref:DUF4082 domain-containing protein n=1 Tax=Tautonia plasticadhaerens TaxID=2527974 RepID=UPI0018D21A9C|nr:DUF4082 domain-containing protein [Tautonia plasticadhaerens]
MDTPASVVGPFSIWNGATFVMADGGDAGPAEVGVKFSSDDRGYILGLRFYKQAANTGTHVARLWTETGTLLASATFANETASGWQQVDFANAVKIDPDKTYVASYSTQTGHFTEAAEYFADFGVYNLPLRASEGVIKEGASGFPAESSETFFGVDVVFDHKKSRNGNDVDPPKVKKASKHNNARDVNIGTNVLVKFDEPMDPATINSNSFELINRRSGTRVSASVQYNAALRTATLIPERPLEPATDYQIRLRRDGNQGARDRAGLPLAGAFNSTFTTAAAPGPAANIGPGGPILVVTAAANQFSRYYEEILRAEGLNAYTVTDISLTSAATLAAHEVVILGEMPLTTAQVTMLGDWVAAGGNLIAMRPDKKLAGLLGLSDASASSANAYLRVNTASAPGAGITGESMQFHGTADRYSLNGASSLATLYANATTPTQFPAVTLRSVGTNGGQAAAFTYDLARSVVYTRQGNPAWAGQERDGFTPIRSSDLFFGNAVGDPQPDWVDLNKVAIPQADEQQRLLANLIQHVNLDEKPLPRFWYFPNGEKAVVLMTGDDHANGGTAGRFDQYLAASPPGGSVDGWETIRGTSYLYPNAPLTNTQAANYHAQGFEVGLHLSTFLNDWASFEELDALYADQLGQWRTKYSSVPSPVTHRTHAIVWSDYVNQPKVELKHGIRLDTNYYYWPPNWVNNRPGFFTGSGIPMRFADVDGTMIDVYQAATQMTDESGQSYSFTINTLLDRALGAEGYYGVFTANMHTDSVSSFGSDVIVASAKARGVPIVTARQMLTWLDGRNNSSFGSISWTGNTLSFTISAAADANGLQAMLPMNFAGVRLTSISRDGNPVPFTTGVIKGIEYGFFQAISGTISATYTADTTAPTVVATSPPNGAFNIIADASVTATFSEPVTAATIALTLRDAGGVAVPATVTYDAATRTATLDPTSPLASGTTYTATLSGATDAAGNAIAPISWSFATVSAPLPLPPGDHSIWGDSTAPTIVSANDAGAVELGVKFRADAAGQVTGLRFYKGPQNTGTHVGHLWTAGGTLLAQATFVGETASGWQQVSFASPVAIAAGATYVASYHAPNGRYAFDSQYFAAAGIANPPIRLLRDGEDGGNGVYRYGPSGSFPNSTYQSANYWVDVVFTAAVADTTAPTVTARSPAAGATGVPGNAVAMATFSEAINASTLTTATFLLSAAGGPPLAAAVSYDPATRTATLQPAAALAAGTSYTATVVGGSAGVKDLAGNPLAADAVWSFTTAAGADTTAPTVTGRSPAAGATGVAVGANVTATFSKALDPATVGTATFELRDPANNLVAATVTYHAPNRRATLNPSANLAAGTTYTARLRGGTTDPRIKDLAGNALAANVTWTFTTAGADTTAPTVTGRSPAAGATGVAVGANVTATFSEAMTASTVGASTFVLSGPGGGAVAAAVTYDAATRTATLDPAANLAAGTSYTATVVGGSAGVKDLAGNPLAADAVWSFTTAAAATNAIVAENQLPGNPPSEWDISGAGSSSIQGYTTEISVDQGQTVFFKIATPATDYRLDIYRMGYYGGLGARKVATAQPSATLPQAQPGPLQNAATGLIDYGNWAVSASWAVPPDAVSGIYFAKLVREDGVAGSSHVVFVVRDDDGQSDILFQTSDTTWQAYNSYGGNSLYVGSPAGRAYKVSYNRPFNTRANAPEDWVFNAEYPMVRWLEANGYDVSYFTGVDSDRRGAEILEHRLFLSVGHDEYWSGGQRANVEAARGAGVNLAFLSGNEVFWKTRWENSIDASGTPYRTLVCYKETHAGAKIDPSPQWTGTWRDPRFSPPADGGRPENALTGTLFLVNAGATTAIRVPEADGKMRLWRNTSVATLGAGQTATLSAQTLGYEWDVDPDNGSRPAGVVRMSTTTVEGAPVLQDHGSTYGSGTATHHLTLYRHPSGARVFGAGTVQWSWGLDENHDRSGPPSDVRIKQATVNLFADMGALPATLQPGLVTATPSTDAVAPSSVITSPAAGSNVSSGSPVTITGTATDTGAGVVGGVELSVDGGTTWHPVTGRGSWSYTWTPISSGSVTIKTRAVDDSGNLETPGAGITLTVGGQSAGANSLWNNATTPAVITDPDAGAVELGVKFRADAAGQVTGLRFYKGPQNTGTHVGHLWTAGGTLLAQATFVGETASGWQQVSFASPVAIAAGATYVASYHAPNGRYSKNTSYFAAAGFANPPLRALRDGEDGPNGVYAYGPSGIFPTSSWNSTNYWVDVVFISGSTTALAVAAESPAAVGTASGVSVGQVTFQSSPPLESLGRDAQPAASDLLTLGGNGARTVPLGPGSPGSAAAWDAILATSTAAKTAPVVRWPVAIAHHLANRMQAMTRMAVPLTQAGIAAGTNVKGTATILNVPAGLDSALGQLRPSRRPVSGALKRLSLDVGNPDD